jgi:hypothetical protein
MLARPSNTQGNFRKEVHLTMEDLRMLPTQDPALMNTDTDLKCPETTPSFKMLRGRRTRFGLRGIATGHDAPDAVVPPSILLETVLQSRDVMNLSRLVEVDTQFP